ncbi:MULTISPECIES: helix-turn-helix transcriptional regulator [Staphylococcus]|uniref:helix-turn-helix transcriptional regulator n=1 Tax=Staphylococcus TaxID=1279 RepID=UPI000852D7C6|nr:MULTISPECIES: helix-turn-helix transcriptional regulator [Staphylococcus]MBN6754437.1 helix-turn-helix transcriptional regulator [Staphylococcus saprophyticus]MBN6764418.1 helix-turn-helix transcriptional regulator [Staphylococcus saprophyticus]MBN6769221.1 helix-turn-helix transcriptional regulator [Staphylococcus saprophyticus]MBN6780934.1 helix-turn-helix transcriptional regulator [Staphylococcus saprophyticus]MBN6786180.1 helix-turn-helix transcriptional regulator [Staphylococcus saprop
MSVYLDNQKAKKLMFIKGFNVTSFAEEVGVGVSYLSQILNGKKTPSPKLAKKIAETLEVEIEEVFSFEEGVVK